jgi:23S rRNA (uracil1939-C5)-methyltransferase
MNLRKGNSVELRIEKMAFGGRGIARLDGLVLFVRGAIPGDRVMARVVKKRKDYAEANITELLEPSPDRIQAPCPYSGHCGGCQWQHVKYEHQLEFKKEHIIEAISRIGALPEVPVHDVIPSEKRYEYRNKMEFSFSDRRWYLPHENVDEGEKKDLGLGLHVPGTFYKVIDIEACLLQHDRGNEILREIKRYVRDCGIPVYGLKSHEGFWRYVTVRYSEACDEWMVNLITSEERREVVEPLSELLCRRMDNIKTVVNNITARKAAIAVGEREILLSGDGYIQDRIGPFSFFISANSFFQTNARGAEALYDTVIEYAELKGAEIVLDLYSGTGTIPIFLSSRAKEVLGIEIAESSILDADRNCRVNGIENVRFFWGDIKERLSTIDIEPDLLIIDPPRAGIHKDILASIMDLAVERMVYVSCNPATLARDLAHMVEGYEIIEIQPVDMFPQTYHVEAVVKLARRK